MRIAGALLLLLARTAAAGPKIPVHYAKLFDATATWTYERAGSEIACKVARIRTIGKIVASEVTCVPDAGDDFPVPGVYLAAPDGLYLSGTGYPESKDDLAPMVLHQLLIAARPKASSKRVTKYASQGGRVLKIETTFGARKEAAQWCWYRTTKSGTNPPTTDTRCFDGGIASGSERGVAYRRH